MVMTPREIVSSYQRAENKKHQLQILADLNLCSRTEIKEILISQGVQEEEIPAFKASRAEMDAANKRKCSEEKKEPKDTAVERTQVKRPKEDVEKQKKLVVVKESMKHMPAAVLEALEKQKSELMAALMENTNKMDELKKVEDNLTRQYAEIVDYISKERE